MAKKWLRSAIRSQEYGLLVFFTLLTIILYPFFESSTNGSIWYHIMITILLLTWVSHTDRSNGLTKIWLFLGGLALVLSRVDLIWDQSYQLHALYMITTFLFFVLITINVIISFLDHKKIDKQVIFGSVAGYLMIGMAWSYLFALIETIYPWSFEPAVSMIGNIPSMLYYTFVSMLTLWYGDMVPVWWHAQVRSILVAVAGQLYLTVLIWVLIGKYVRDK